MSGIWWIVVGITAGAFSLFAVPYGFERKQKEKDELVAKLQAGSFSLIDSVYDLRVEDVDPRAVPDSESGRLTAILEVYEEGNVDLANARLLIGGSWVGSSGVIPEIKQDLVVYIKSESAIRTLQKKPFVELISPAISKLYADKVYVFRLMAMPPIAHPLRPAFLLIRTKDGHMHEISNFTPSTPVGWYEARFVFKNE